ncbi:transposase [Elysia marginata]|uniref:Transposase n=1 Tax=Elysia marginata TaxID=1093978 RepID=A0AAV4GVQ8_9GAST|nr:transposase [Elysia marginata]
MLNMFEPHGSKRLSDIVTGDETWFPFFIIPPKRLNRMWVDRQGDRPVVLRPGLQSQKRIFTVFFNYSGPLVVDILPQDTTMTATYYVQNVLSRLKSAINEQRPKRVRFGPGWCNVCLYRKFVGACLGEMLAEQSEEDKLDTLHRKAMYTECAQD